MRNSELSIQLIIRKIIFLIMWIECSEWENFQGMYGQKYKDEKKDCSTVMRDGRTFIKYTKNVKISSVGVYTVQCSSGMSSEIDENNKSRKRLWLRRSQENLTIYVLLSGNTLNSRIFFLIHAVYKV